MLIATLVALQIGSHPIDSVPIRQGTITEGAGKVQPVETSSRLSNFGPNGSLSDIDGRMVIAGEVE